MSQSRLPASQLRVLIVTACYYKLDGVVLTIRKIRDHCRSLGIPVRIVTSCIDPTIEIEDDILLVPSVGVPFAEKEQGYSFGRAFSSDLQQAIEDFDPNVVHFTVPDPVALHIMRWAKRNHKAIMATWHSNYPDYLWYYKACLLRPLLVGYLSNFYSQIPFTFVPTRFIREKLQNDGACCLKYETPGLNELRVWGRGVDTIKFNPEKRSQAFRARYGIEDHEVVVLWVSRVVLEKRPDIYLEVMKTLVAEKLPVKGLVIGEGPVVPALREVPNVQCLGWKSGLELEEAYASSDILLFPSAVETFGNVTLEGMASGIPVMVERCCGGHLVRDGITGFAIADGDLQGYIRATRELVQNSEKRKQFGANARKRAVEEFELKVIANMMVENYIDAIECREEFEGRAAHKTWFRWSINVFWFLTVSLALQIVCLVQLFEETTMALCSGMKSLLRKCCCTAGQASNRGSSRNPGVLDAAASSLPPLRYVVFFLLIVALAIELPTILQLVVGLQDKYASDLDSVDAGNA